MSEGGNHWGIGYGEPPRELCTVRACPSCGMMVTFGGDKPDPLAPIEGEPDRAEVLEAITWSIMEDASWDCLSAAEIDNKGRVVVELGGYRYRLALVAVEEVE